MTLQAISPYVERCYKEHASKILPFLARVENEAINATNSKTVPLCLVDDILCTYQVAKERFEESSLIKSKISLAQPNLSDRNFTSFHESLKTLVDKQLAIDEKVNNKHANFLGTLVMILFGVLAIPTGLICSYSWVVTAGVVFLFVGYAVSAFNFIYYHEEEKKLINEFSLILDLLKKIINSPTTNLAQT